MVMLPRCFGKGRVAGSPGARRLLWNCASGSAAVSGMAVGKIGESASNASFEPQDGIGSWRAADAIPANDPDNQDFSWAERQAERRRPMERVGGVAR